MRVPAARFPLLAAKRSRFARGSARAGMTLLELTVVVLVLMSLISILFVGATAWKRGADRSQCIIQIRNVQKGVRCHANFRGLDPGSTMTDLKDQVIGYGKYIESTPQCPGNGTYAYGTLYGINTIPPIGVLYMDCSLAGSESHKPDNSADW